MAFRALGALGAAPELVRASALAQDGLAGKKVLVVPGGVARRKRMKLGEAGAAAIRNFVARGGTYVGFCGGAGLALEGRHGLGLCPWRRADTPDRTLSLVSGHVGLDVTSEMFGVPAGSSVAAPVWWPSSFKPQGEGVTVLASYAEPAEDFWIADLPLKSLPKGTLADWEARYGIRLSRTGLSGAPAIIGGDFGKGRFLASYPHLESPASPEANRLLRKLLESLLDGDLKAGSDEVPDWTHAAQVDPAAPESLVRANAVLSRLIALGREHHLLFNREPWLLGWRTGFPGANLNNLVSLLSRILQGPISQEALDFAKAGEVGFATALDRFEAQATPYFLAERLSMTLYKSHPDKVSSEALTERRNALFGWPMEQGGLYAELLDHLDELAFLTLRGAV